MKKLIDLTHKIDGKMPVYPGTPSPEIRSYSTVEKNGFAELLFSMVTHTGTHIDAPCHIIKGAKSLTDFEIDKFSGKAAVIDCSDRKDIGLELIRKNAEMIKKSDFVLFRSGWSEKWGKKDYFGKFPVLSKKAAECLSDFKLKGIGFDYVSVDAMDAKELVNHKIFLSKEILIIENLNSMDKLPDGKTFRFFCPPLMIDKADGSPVRAFAEI